MKIAMMVRGYLPVPRPVDIVYAPIDLSVAIGEGLTKRGHKVDFYAPKGSHLKIKVEHLNLRTLVSNQKDFHRFISQPDLLSHYVLNLWDTYLVSEMFKRAANGEYDLLYFAHPEVALPFVKLYPKVPVVYTLHDPIHEWYREIFNLYKSPNQHFISISNSQRRSAPRLHYAATIYNGVDSSLFTYNPKPDDYLLYVGRVVREKGVKEAIQIAQRTNNKLLIIGPTYPDKLRYFNTHVKPHLNRSIRYLGYIPQNQLMPYYQKAKAFLAPLQWEEPFGLTLIESMACGTPVIALDRGSAPELISNGKTGYVVKTIGQMVEAVKKIDNIKREDCRRHIEDKFSIDKMVSGYENTFKSIIKAS